MDDNVVIAPERLGHDRSAPASWCGSVFLPAQRVPAGAEEVLLEVRRLVDDRMALFVYSTLKQLVDGCGPDQPWVAVDASRIDAVQRVVSADLVVWDVPLPADLRHTRDVAR